MECITERPRIQPSGYELGYEKDGIFYSREHAKPLKAASPGLSVVTYPAEKTDFLALKPSRVHYTSIKGRLRVLTREPTFTMVRRNAMLTVKADYPAMKRDKWYDHDRGEVREFSKASRKRFFEKMMEINWDAIEQPLYFVTLTYPALFPTDGAITRRHLEAFTKKLERKYGKLFYAWKREFQRRGAPHYHLMIAVEEADLERLQAYVSETWALYAYDGFTGPVNPDDMQAGTQVERVRSPQRAAGYLAEYMCKADQNSVPKEVLVIKKGKIIDRYPAAFTNTGRWWGFWRDKRVTRRREETPLTAYQYNVAVALIKAHWAANRLPEYRSETKIELREYKQSLNDIHEIINAER